MSLELFIEKLATIYSKSSNIGIRSTIYSNLKKLTSSDSDVKAKAKALVDTYFFLTVNSYSFSNDDALFYKELIALQKRLNDYASRGLPETELQTKLAKSAEFIPIIEKGSKDLADQLASEIATVRKEKEKEKEAKEEQERQEKIEKEEAKAKLAKAEEDKKLKEKEKEKAEEERRKKEALEKQQEKDKRTQAAPECKKAYRVYKQNLITQHREFNKNPNNPTKLFVKPIVKGNAAHQALAELQSLILEGNWNAGNRGRKIYDEKKKHINTVDKEMIPVLDEIEKAYLYEEYISKNNVEKSDLLIANKWLDTFKKVMQIGQHAANNPPKKFLGIVGADGYSPEVQKFFAKFKFVEVDAVNTNNLKTSTPIAPIKTNSGAITIKAKESAISTTSAHTHTTRATNSEILNNPVAFIKSIDDALQITANSGGGNNQYLNKFLPEGESLSSSTTLTKR